MKVLFVCHYNIGRSQMAKALYNHLTHSLDADAAGTHVDQEGQTLLERKATSTSKDFFVLDVMKDEDIDMSRFARRTITQNDLQKYDLIVSMAGKEDAPGWLLDSPKYIYWEVKDPRGQDYETTAAARDLIKQKVQKLIDETRA